MDMKKEIAYKTPYGYFYNGKAIVKKPYHADGKIGCWYVGEQSFVSLKYAKQYIDENKNKERETT